MKRTATELADGREIIYFDEDDSAVRDLVDHRDLPERAGASQLRFDPLREEWVAVASHRQTRTHLPPSGECPLCPSIGDRATEVPSRDYDVVVFENRFPSFAGELTGAGSARDATGSDGLAPQRAGVGRCEVVCFTSDHDTSFAALTPARVRTVVEAWADRTAELADVSGVEEVFCFENRGEDIGVTLHHPHGQIYGYPFVTPRTRAELDSVRRHQHRTWRNLYADVLAAEWKDGSRVVCRGAHWTAFVPSAARWPVEVQLYPNRQVPDIPALSGEERDDFATVYLDVLRRMDRLFDAPLPYIAAWRQAPVRADRELAYLHLEVFSIRRSSAKLKYLAGSESAMGVFVNDLTPETIAERLRDAGA